MLESQDPVRTCASDVEGGDRLNSIGLGLILDALLFVAPFEKGAGDWKQR